MRATSEAVTAGASADDVASRARDALAAVVFVPDARAAERDGTPGGLALLERQLTQLRALGTSAVWLLVREREAVPAMAGRWGADHVVRVPDTTATLMDALAACASVVPPAFLAVSADRLVDRRVFAAVRGRPRSAFASDDGVTAEPVAWVRREDLRQHGAALVAHADRVPLAAIDPYLPELRGTAAPYVLAASTPDERRIAWRVLLDHVQKRALDLPGQYFDTPFENALVRRLAPTAITPNQITLLTLVVAAGVAFLFAEGWLRVGIVLALVVGILDGVDGKLARLKLATSKLGELEHIGDFFYENAWYLALASHFHGTVPTAGFWHAGLALVALDLADSLLYLAVRRGTGRMLDELTPFDRRFRAVAGRRNVYVMILAAGVFAGAAPTAFLCVVAWAATTVAVHGLRAVQVLRAVPRTTGA